ncbi:MAG: hypothetical protein WC455_20285, partial [Dehalococcoidia bacterium]
DFDGGKAPALQVYQANYKTFLWSVKNGISAANLTGNPPFMYWTTNNAPDSQVVTAICTIVNATAGTFTATFKPADLNHAASNWIYGVGMSSNGLGVTVARQGTFTILADAYAMGNTTNSTVWTSTINCDTITFINGPWEAYTNAGYSKAESDAKYSTGTPLYVESYTGSVGSVAGLATGTPLYVETYTGSVGSVAGLATGTPLYVETYTGTIASVAGLATGTPLYVEAGTGLVYSTAGLATGTPLYAYTETDTTATNLLTIEIAARIAHDGTNTARIIATGAGATNYADTVGKAIGLGATNLVAVETAARIAHDSTNAANTLAVGAGATNLVNASGAGSTNYADTVSKAVGAGATNLYTVEAAARAAHDSTNAANILAVGAGATNIARATGAGATNIAAAVGAGATNLYAIEAAARLAWDTTNAAAAASANTNANGRVPYGVWISSNAALQAQITAIAVSNVSISEGTNIQVVSSGGGSAYTINLKVNADMPILPASASTSVGILWHANGSGIHTTRWGTAGFLIDGNTAFHSGNLNTNSFAPIASWAAFTAAYSTAASAQISTNAGFQTAIDSKMSITSLVPVLTVANLSSVGTNLTALTAAYTGTLGGVIVYTGAVDWVAGKTYSVGLGLSATYLGTSWLSIAEHRLTNSAIGTSVSNYFSAATSTGTMTLSIASVAGMAQIVTNVFVREVVTGNVAVAGTLDAGQDARFGQDVYVNGQLTSAGLVTTGFVQFGSLIAGSSEALTNLMSAGTNVVLLAGGLVGGPTTNIRNSIAVADGQILGSARASFVAAGGYLGLTLPLDQINEINQCVSLGGGAKNTNANSFIWSDGGNNFTRTNNSFYVYSRGGIFLLNGPIYGDGLYVTNLNAASIAAGGTLPALDGTSVSNVTDANAMPISGGTFTGPTTNNQGLYGNCKLTNASWILFSPTNTPPGTGPWEFLTDLTNWWFKDQSEEGGGEASNATTLVYGGAKYFSDVTLSNSATATWYIEAGTSNLQVNVPAATAAVAAAATAQATGDVAFILANQANTNANSRIVSPTNIETGAMLYWTGSAWSQATNIYYLGTNFLFRWASTNSPARFPCDGE